MVVMPYGYSCQKTGTVLRLLLTLARKACGSDGSEIVVSVSMIVVGADGVVALETGPAPEGVVISFFPDKSASANF